MDVNYINPFLDSVLNVMPQLGLSDITKGNIGVKGKTIQSSGVLIVVGIMGDLKGNVIYRTTIECGKKIASKMMMGMDVREFDELAQSAVSELANMLTATTATILSEQGIKIDISTPTLMSGNDFKAIASTDKVLSIDMIVEGMSFEVNISIERN